MLEQWCQDIDKCWNIGPKGSKLTSQIWWYPFSALGPIQGHKVQHFISKLGQIEKFFSISAWTPSVKPLGLILSFAPIGMLDLGWTFALNSKCEGGLTDNSLFPHTKQGRPANDPSCLQLLFSKRNLPRESISQLNWIPVPPCSKPSSWQVESGNNSCW